MILPEMPTIHEIEGNPCPHCGHALNHCADLGGSDEPPRPGDLSLCVQCGNILEFDDTLRRRAIPLDQLRELLDEQPQLREMLRQWANAGPLTAS